MQLLQERGANANRSGEWHTVGKLSRAGGSLKALPAGGFSLLDLTAVLKGTQYFLDRHSTCLR